MKKSRCISGFSSLVAPADISGTHDDKQNEQYDYKRKAAAVSAVFFVFTHASPPPCLLLLQRMHEQKRWKSIPPRQEKSAHILLPLGSKRGRFFLQTNIWSRVYCIFFPQCPRAFMNLKMKMLSIRTAGVAHVANRLSF